MCKLGPKTRIKLTFYTFYTFLKYKMCKLKPLVHIANSTFSTFPHLFSRTWGECAQKYFTSLCGNVESV